MKKSNSFVKALVISGLIELPLSGLLIYLAATGALDPGPPYSLPMLLLLFYHVAPFTVLGVIWLLLFGHGAPHPGPVWLWHDVFAVLLCLLQVPVIAWAIHPYIDRDKRKQKE